MYAVTTASCHRRDISDRAGELLAPHRPGGPGKVGRPDQDNRRFTNAVFWTLRTGVTGRDLPSDYGDDGAGGMTPVIPSKRSRKATREYVRELYRLCHLVENGFERFKEWRGAATRYAKKAASYLAICQIRSVIPLDQDNMTTRPSPVVNRPRF